MGMQMPIPPKLIQELAANPWYQKCCLYDGTCSSGKIDWHHNLIFAGKRINAAFAILPVCVYHHGIEKRTDIKDRLNHIMLNRMTEDELDRYSKAINFRSERSRLNEKYSVV